MPSLLSLQGIAKDFGAVRALRGVDLEVQAGEVLAICGDNGAGKSTLIRIVSGAQTPSAGEMRLRDAPVVFGSPQDALAQGVATIYQDLALAPRLAIYQNVFMGAELTRPLLAGLPAPRLLDKAAMRAAARDYLRQLGIALDDMNLAVESLSGGQRQAVAIGRALRWNAELIVMDEPTAALGVRETAQVLALIRRLNEQGKTVILVSHNMADVVAVAQRVVILKNGAKIADRPLADLTADALSHMVMTGKGADGSG